MAKYRHSTGQLKDEINAGLTDRFRGPTYFGEKTMVQVRPRASRVHYGLSRSRLAALIELSKSSPSLLETVDSATRFPTLGIWNPLRWR